MCEPRASDWGGSHAGPSGGKGGSGVTLKPEQRSRQECAEHVGVGAPLLFLLPGKSRGWESSSKFRSYSSSQISFHRACPGPSRPSLLLWDILVEQGQHGLLQPLRVAQILWARV